MNSSLQAGRPERILVTAPQRLLHSGCSTAAAPAARSRDASDWKAFDVSE
ncbi:hypothetical protein [Catalinimonas niigatensis]|nr:hypothetical protein [Catalinimonas niigatensis]WPP49954.1 hypothetical protein PZB72_25150 [Catalinimonas niigatensis]